MYNYRKIIQKKVILSATINNTERDLLNLENKQSISQFEFIQRIDTSEKYQNNNLEAIIDYSKFFGQIILLYR
jgi:hypothetical protein